MRRLLLLALLLLPGLAAAETGGDDGMRLTVKPLLCIVDNRTPSCDMSFLVVWQSVASGYYCLFSDFDDAPHYSFGALFSRSHGYANDRKENFAIKNHLGNICRALLFLLNGLFAYLSVCDGFDEARTEHCKQEHGNHAAHRCGPE